jgi:hypothetical protein
VALVVAAARVPAAPEVLVAVPAAAAGRVLAAAVLAAARVARRSSCLRR